MRTEQFETPGDVELEIGIKSGSVAVTTHDEATTTVEVDAVDPEAVERMVIEHSVVGERHRIEVRTPGQRFQLRRADVQVRVTVPTMTTAEISTASAVVVLDGRYLRANVRTASGEIAVGRVDTDLDVTSASGDVSADQVGGSTRVRTASGDVRIGQLVGGSIATASGDVKVNRADVELSATSGSGDIRLGTAGPCKLRTASGDVSIERLTQGEANLKSVSGDVSVAVAPGRLIRVDAESMTGSLKSDIDLSSESDPGSGSRDDPQVDLVLRSVSGDITVSRAG